MAGEARARAAGALVAAAVACLAAAIVPRLVPDGHFAGPLARILDGLAPWALGSALLLAAAAAALGARRTGAGLALAALAAGGHLWAGHRALTLPAEPGREGVLRVAFLNAFEGNAGGGAAILAAAGALDADILVFAEAGPVARALAEDPGLLGPGHEILPPCPADPCEILIAVRQTPVRHWRLRLNPVWEARYAVLETRARGGAPVFLAVAHLAKPWLSGIAEAERARVIAQLDWFPEDRPVVVVGDFNAAPWSRPMREILAATGLRAPRRPIATWPAGAGAFGLPVDHVLVGHGARVAALAPWGAETGSNHRGLVADIALGPPDGG